MSTALAPPVAESMAHAPARAARRQAVLSHHNSRATWAWNTLALFLAAAFGFPVYWMLITAFKTSGDINRLVPQFWPHHPTLRGFREVLGDPIFRDDLLNSVLVTLGAVVVSVVVGLLAALSIARFRFLGRRVFIIAVLIVQMVPLLALTIPLSLLLDQVHLKNTLPGVILAYLMFTTPYTVWTLRTFIAAIPKELDEAALVDGCTRMRVFTKILLPLVGTSAD